MWRKWNVLFAYFDNFGLAFVSSKQRLRFLFKLCGVVALLTFQIIMEFLITFFLAACLTKQTNYRHHFVVPGDNVIINESKKKDKSPSPNQQLYPFLAASLCCCISKCHSEQTHLHLLLRCANVYAVVDVVIITIFSYYYLTQYLKINQSLQYEKIDYHNNHEGPYPTFTICLPF